MKEKTKENSLLVIVFNNLDVLHATNSPHNEIRFVVIEDHVKKYINIYIYLYKLVYNQ